MVLCVVLLGAAVAACSSEPPPGEAADSCDSVRQRYVELQVASASAADADPEVANEHVSHRVAALTSGGSGVELCDAMTTQQRACVLGSDDFAIARECWLPTAGAR